MNDRRELLEKLWPADPPLVVEVAGDSMSPSLERGWKVRIEPITGEISPGDILLFDLGGRRPLLHRAVHVFERDGILIVIQRGDAGGPLTLTPVKSVIGRATAVLTPPAHSLPEPARLTKSVRRTYSRAKRWARLFTRLSTRFPKTQPIFDRALSLAGRRLFELDSVVSWELPLPQNPARTPRLELEVREITRDRSGSPILPSGLPMLDAAEINSSVQGTWRCFVAFLEGEPVHSSLLDMRADAPHLFRVWTIPSRRQRGIFSEFVRVIADRLSAEGHSRITSSSNSRNSGSARAHAAAGFVETDRTLEWRVLGVRPSRWVSRWLSIRRRGPSG